MLSSPWPPLLLVIAGLALAVWGTLKTRRMNRRRLMLGRPPVQPAPLPLVLHLVGNLVRDVVVIFLGAVIAFAPKPRRGWIK